MPDLSKLTDVAEPTPDPRVVALQNLVDAEQHERSATWRAKEATRAAEKAREKLEAARVAYKDAIAGTRL